ncbi:MAG: DUF2029 domain-containing protein [Anaerolineae bacterium]|nr:DUF2029 domain-containing protein [Anaerolineae bacterium]
MALLRPKIIILTALILLVLVGDVVLTHHYLTEPYPGHNDFLPHWEGARSFWQEGISPYDARTTLNIQMRMFGREAQPGEDPNFYAYPFFYTFFLIPLTYFSYDWAAAIWMVLLEVCLVVSVFLLLDLFRWKPRPLLLASLLLWTIISYYPARGLLLGQVSLVVYCLEVLSLWALARGQDRLAGAVLAISTLKPQMAFLLVPLLLLWALRARRRAFVISFIATFAASMALSFVLLPSWLSDWLDVVRRYPEYTAAAFPDSAGSPVWILFGYYLNVGDVVQGIVNLACVAVLLWSWYLVLIKGREETLMWSIMITLTITNLVAFRTATPNYVVFTIPLVYYLKVIAQHSRRWGGLWAGVVLLALLVFHWAHFLITIQGRGDSEHGSLLLPLPFGMLLVLLLTRRLWWRAQPLLETAGSSQRTHASMPLQGEDAP